MSKSLRRLVTGLVVVTLLLLPVVPANAEPSPNEQGPASLWHLTVWVDWLFSGAWWGDGSVAAASQEQPNGSTLGPKTPEPLEPDSPTTYSTTSDGETFPDMDPNG